MRDGKLARRDIRCKEALLSIDNFNRLYLEWHLAVFRERPDDVIEADEGLGTIEGSDLDEDVAGIDGDLGMLTIDDGWNWADHIVAIQNQGVDWTVAD